jgi:hypothetical protein
MSEKRPPGHPPRPVAPHVRAATGAVQAKPSTAPGPRPPAPHVRTAVGAAQARLPVPPAPAPGFRARLAEPPPAYRPPAPAARAGKPAVQQKPAIQQRQPPAVRTAPPVAAPPAVAAKPANPGTIQPRVGFEYELGDIKTEKRTRRHPAAWSPHSRGEMIRQKTGYNVTADSGPNNTSQLEFIITDIDENNAADCARAVLAARSILADTQDLAQAQNVGQWVTGDQTRIRSSQSHRFLVEVPIRQLVGQLQATAGLSVGQLPEVVSGRAADRPALRNNRALPYLGNYRSRNVQPIWHAARAAVRRFQALNAHQQEVLASVVTMIAQVPLSFRNETPGGQGMFTAKTDFSKVLAETISYIGQPIRQRSFEAVVLETINAVIRQGLHPNNTLTAADDVFPAGYQANGVALNGVTIGQWVRSMLPAGVGQQGQDLMTPHDFPGTRRQREEMRAFGRMGNRVDAGNRPIFEFRNLTTVYPQDLPDVVSGVLDYVRSANTPPARGLGATGYLVTAAAAAALLYVGNQAYRWWYQ